MITETEYYNWIKQLKRKFQQTQIKSAVEVNSNLLRFYWDLGAEIVEKQEKTVWGSKFLDKLSTDLKREFPDVRGFSLTNIKYIRLWYLFYYQELKIGQQLVGQFQNKPTEMSQHLIDHSPDSLASSGVSTIGQQPIADLYKWPVDQLFQIPWGHHIAIITKCKSISESFYYVSNTIKYGWSRSVLVHQIESDLYNREGKAISNFRQTLPAPQSDLAIQTLKDPYVFDFFTMRADFNERELEQNLVDHITKFLLELGAGFAYMGSQVPLYVGDREFSVDLLFYQTKLHSYIVVELKKTDFEPEYAGKLNFYIKAVDEQFRQKGDEPTIGLMLVKSKDKVVAEYALSDIHKPIGISEYRLTTVLPDKLKSSLPTIEEIENELSKKNFSNRV